MRVINLTHWAGRDFLALPGEEIDLPDAVAVDRIAAGLCRAISPTRRFSETPDLPVAVLPVKARKSLE